MGRNTVFAKSHVTFPLAFDFPAELIRLDRFGMEIGCREKKTTSIDGFGKELCGIQESGGGVMVYHGLETFFKKKSAIQL